MKTSYKKGENFIQNPSITQNITVTPFTPRKQLNFTSNKLKKYDISCSQREQDRENLKNNLLLTYIESQNCPDHINNKIQHFSSKKQKSRILINQKKNQFSKQISNKLIVSIYYIFLTVNYILKI